MSVREWLAGFALVEIALICVAIRTGWRWHRIEPVRRFGWALRRHWARILVGAFYGWVLSVILGVALIALVYETYGVGVDGNELAESVSIALPLVGVAVGGWAGYRTA